MEVCAVCVAKCLMEACQREIGATEVSARTMNGEQARIGGGESL